MVKLSIKSIDQYVNLIFFKKFACIIVFIAALDATIAINRWWTESNEAYLQNLTVMTFGFLVFSLLASRSRLDMLGLIIFSVAIFYIANYEIGGPSKLYLTPFDKLFGVDPVFEEGKTWMGMYSIEYRLNFAVVTSVLAAFILTVSNVKHLTSRSSEA